MPRRHLIGLASILLAALALRLYQLGKPGLWLDEILTVQLSTGRGYAHLDFPQNQLISPPPDLIALDAAPPFWRIWTSLDRDVHPPLYYLLLRAWREALGDGDVAIRMLPVTLSLAAIILLYLAVAPRFGAPAALWACALMALAGPQIEYAQENRSYMLLLVALLGAAAALVCIEARGWTVARAITLSAATLAALLTHYAAIPVVGLFVVYALLRRQWGAAVAVAAAGAVFVVVWGPFWLDQVRGFGRRIEFTRSSDGSIFRTLRFAAELPLRYFTDAAVRPRWAGVLAAALYVLPALLIFVRRRVDLLLWWLWLVGYVLVITVSDVMRGGRAVELIRYALPASPAAYALVVALLADARSRWARQVVPALLLVACVAALPAAYARSKADWRGLGQFFASRASGDDAIVVASSGPDDWRARCMYLCLRHYAPRPPLPVAFVSEREPGLTEQLIGRRVWLLSGAYVVQDESLLPGWRLVEMRGDPMAGTVALMMPDDHLPQPRKTE